MRKYRFILVSLLLSVFISFSQTNTWFKSGEQWTYLNPNPPYNVPISARFQNITIKPIGDTLIKNKTCRILDIRYCVPDSAISHEYLYENEDTVFYYNYYNDQFYTLFNFNARPGDTVWVHKTSIESTKGFIWGGSSQFAYKVVSVTCVNLGNQTVTSQLVSSVNVFSTVLGHSIPIDHSYIWDTVITKFQGPLIYLFGSAQGFITEANPGFLVRYELDNQGLYNSPIYNASGKAFDCKTLARLNEPMGKYDKIIVFQSGGVVKIKGEEEITKVTLYNTTGIEYSQIYSYSTDHKSYQFSSQSLEGIYIMKIQSENEIYVKKIFLD